MDEKLHLKVQTVCTLKQTMPIFSVCNKSLKDEWNLECQENEMQSGI